MRAISFVTLILSCIISLAQTQQNAEGKEFPEAKAKKVVARMKGIASLTTEQVNKVNDIYIDYYKQKDALKNNKVLSKSDLKEKADAIKSKREKQLKQVLTAEQLKKWQEYKDAQKEKIKQAEKDARKKVEDED